MFCAVVVLDCFGCLLGLVWRLVSLDWFYLWFCFGFGSFVISLLCLFGYWFLVFGRLFGCACLGCSLIDLVICYLVDFWVLNSVRGWYNILLFGLRLFIAWVCCLGCICVFGVVWYWLLFWFLVLGCFPVVFDILLLIWV